MNLYEFMSGSPFLGFLLICSAYYLCQGLLFTFRRVLRFCSVAARGWPPEHLDADGDFRPEPERGDDREASHGL